ncbi:hypothetical protein ACSSVY_000903, partial [Roseovarius sp. MBR-51]
RPRHVSSPPCCLGGNESQAYAKEQKFMGALPRV